MANNLLQIDASISENGTIVLNYKVENLKLSQVEKLIKAISEQAENITVEKSTGALKIPRKE